MSRRIFVLSDLHLGPGGPMTSFHEDARLCRLLRSWARLGLDELVLAGDIFDFLQLPGYDGFSAAQAPQRFETIAKHPPSANVLEALRELAASPRLELTVLAGSRDPELLLGEVRAAFEDKLGRRGAVRWADDAPLSPRDGKRAPLWGWAVHGPGAERDVERQAWIVHGDRWDAQAAFDRDELRRCVRAGEPVALPAGSQLVFEVLAKVIRSSARRWVTELVPELAQGLVVLAMHPKELAAYLRRHFRVGERMLAAKLKQRVTRGAAAPACADDDAPTSFADELVEGLADQLAASSAAVRDAFLGGFEAFLVQGAPPTVDRTLGKGSLRDTLLRAACRASAAARVDDRAGPDRLAERAARTLPAGLGALVAGQSHVPRAHAQATPRYYNAGAWTPVCTLGDSLDDVLRRLESPHRAEPSFGTYVRIEVGDGRPAVSLEVAPP